jgi:NCS1 family nucleobase:cation symporter-1
MHKTSERRDAHDGTRAHHRPSRKPALVQRGHRPSLGSRALEDLGIAVATVGINIILRFVSPAYDFANVWPSKIDFRRGGLITAVLVMPWKLYANPIAVNYFIGGVGALMGPLLGIMLVDYYYCVRPR